MNIPPKIQNDKNPNFQKRENFVKIAKFTKTYKNLQKELKYVQKKH